MSIFDRMTPHPEVVKAKAIVTTADILKIPKPEEYSEQLKKILEIAHEIAPYTGKINPIVLLTVDNVVETKKRFLANPTENPTFSYANSVGELKAAVGEDIQTVLEKLKAAMHALLHIRCKRGTIDQIARIVLGSIIRDHTAALRMAQGLENNDELQVKQALGRMYGERLDPETIANAETFFQAALVPDDERVAGGVIRQDLATAIVNLTRTNTLTNTEAGLQALQQLRKDDPKNACLYVDAQQVADAFSWALEKYYAAYKEKYSKEIDEHHKYTIIVTDKASSIDVQEKSPDGKRIVIPRYRIMTVKTLLELIEHEIEAHARQGLNGSSDRLGGLGGGALKISDEVLMEGLALTGEEKINREMFGIDPEMSLGRLLYIFAEDLASQGKDFVAVFNAIKQRVILYETSRGRDVVAREKKISETAWLAAYRAFRGHLDTSNGNAFASLKDRAYFEGYLMAKQLEQEGISHLNEAAIPQVKALRLLARLDIPPETNDFQRLGLAKRYYEEVIGPDIERTFFATNPDGVPVE